MEFKEFCRERSRMCKFNQYCSRCDIGDKKEPGMCADYCVKNPDEAEKIVSEWAKEHPIVTNRKKFEEVFGFNIMTKPEKEEDFTMSRDELLSRVEKWLQQEYKPPRKENADES